MDENGGTTGNLSNHEGELDALDQAIKDCLLDKEQLENEKELKKDLAKELNTKESDLIQGQLAKEAKESRQKNTLTYKVVSKCTSSSSSPSTLENDSSQSATSRENTSKQKAHRMTADERIISLLLGKQNEESPAAKKQKQASQNAAPEITNRERDKDLRKKFTVFENGNFDQFITESRLSLSATDILEAISLDVVVDSYCCNNRGTETNPTEFKSEMEAYGMTKLDATKLQLYLRVSNEKSYDQWLQEHQHLLPPQPSLLDDFLF